MKYMLLLSIFLAFTCRAKAQSDVAGTGNLLIKNCSHMLEPHEAKDGGFNRAYCFGYIDAMNDLLHLESKPVYCEPTGVTKGQIYKIVLKYLDESPAQLHLDTYSIVRFALQGAFPCHK